MGTLKHKRRVKDILEQNKFYCSRIWEMNDPMECVYHKSLFDEVDSKEYFNLKNSYMICSFSGETRDYIVLGAIEIK